jgi:hypothetical protein
VKQYHLFDFHDARHVADILRAISKIDMPFVRIGELGDPSEAWEHTIDICDIISAAKKSIVIITKHWKTIPEKLINNLRMLDLCINTSISALDSDVEIEHRLGQYNRLKGYCNSVLRIVSCRFNTETEEGKRRAAIQDNLFLNENTINTVFRPSNTNSLVTKNIIYADRVDFLRSSVLASQFREDSYLGRCDTCPDMCGINVKYRNNYFPTKTIFSDLEVSAPTLFDALEMESNR